MIFLEDELADEQAPPTPTPQGAPAFGGDPNDFHIDAHTREIGRRGIAAARQALAEAVRRAAAREQTLAA